MRKKISSVSISIISLALTGILLMGCGADRQNAEADVSQKLPLETQQPVVAEPTEEAAEGIADAPETAAGALEEAQATEQFEDNYAVSSEAAKEFARKVQDVIAKKDIDGLAALTSFPVYVGLPGVGAVETREDMISLGADTLFTEQLMDSVETADIDNFQPSKAGFSISNGGTANINFGVVNGVLAISGINY